jgi:quercetin dioxygenase-like cupin family protein
MARTTVWTLALVALVFVFGAGWAAGVAFAKAEAPVPGTSVPAAEGFGFVALRNTYDPGESSPRHTHAKVRLVVVLAGGTLEVTGADGEARTVDLAAGQVMLRGPETHALRNIGPSTVEMIEMDVPECENRGQQP